MAERRMLNKALLHNGNFIQLSRAAFQLYIYLAVSADDDGFTDSAATLFRTLRCNAKHLQELIDGGWILSFDSGVVAVTHWYQHNQIKKDRYKPTVFQQERAMLDKTPTGIYVRLDTPRNQFGSTVAPQCSVDKDRLEKDSLDQQRLSECISPQTADHTRTPPGAAASDDIEIDFSRILKNYHLLCPELPPCEALTEGMQEQVRNFCRAGGDTYYLNTVFYKASQSPWLQGENPSGWKPDLAWLLTPKNMEEVYSGKYDRW